MIRFLLCQPCKRAWTAARVEPCDLCGVEPIAISPFAGERRVWFDVKVTADRRPDIFAAAYYVERADQKRSLARAIVAKGNTTARLVASC